jgi:hypothetical protein
MRLVNNIYIMSNKTCYLFKFYILHFFKSPLKFFLAFVPVNDYAQKILQQRLGDEEQIRKRRRKIELSSESHTSRIRNILGENVLVIIV